MSKKKRERPLYQRGGFRLDWDRKSNGSLRSANLAVFWYDVATGRGRSRSTGTAVIEEAKAWLDDFYLEQTSGRAVCYACHRPLDGADGYPVADAIATYQTLYANELASSGAIASRLDHVLDYLNAKGKERVTCEEIDEDWIRDFRKWSAKQPVYSSAGKYLRERSLSTTEASVAQLSAAINDAKRRRNTKHGAAFKSRPANDLNQSPQHRSDIAELAAMFRYCIEPDVSDVDLGKWGRRKSGYSIEEVIEKRRKDRAALHRFLIVSVATWARPDAAHDLSTDKKRAQWLAKAGVIALNPKGRRQTKKYRSTVPCAWQFAHHLNAAKPGYFVGVKSIRKAWERMAAYLGLPDEGEAGTKLIRRSMATLGRARLGEESWIQGRIMLGHVPETISDIYALRAMENMGKVLAVTEAIIDEIEKLTPGAFALPGQGVAMLRRK